MNVQWILAQAAATGEAVRSAPKPGASSNIFSAGYWFGSAGASAQAIDTENLFMYILWVNIISFVLLMLITGWFVLKYRRSREAENYQVSAAHNTPLELAWSIIPLLVMVPIFYYGFTYYVDKLAAPSDSENITVIGKKWNWDIVYRNGAQPQETVRLTETQYDVPEFVVPAGRPVKLIMTSDDVLHAFYIPAFRTKMDVIPNRYTSMWFLPEDRPGATYEVFCAEYCGEKHSEMAAQIKVLPPKEYEAQIKAWAEGPKSTWTLREWGEKLWALKGCKGCHSIDGSAGTGPTWKDHFGNTHEYADGSTHVADEQWLHDNILNSQKILMKGFQGNMPVYAGQLKPLDMQALIVFIKTLSDKNDPAAVDAAEAEYARQKEEAAKAKGAPK
jgi:cytochrome c oxidase subunit II